MAKTKLINKHYETLESALVDAIKPAWEGFGRSSQKTTDAEWFGSKNYETAERLAREGWPDGLKSMARNVSALSAIASVASGPSLFYDVAGSYPMAALAAAGLPESMVNFAPISERVRPIVRLMIPVMASGSYESEAFLNYGSGLVAIIDNLESNNFRVELTTFIAAERDKEKCLLSVRIKEAQEPVNLDKLSFCLSHVSYFRRIGFALMERNLSPEVWSGEYGRPRIPDAEEIESDVILLAGVQQFPWDSATLKTPEACFAAMIPVLSAQLADKFADFPPLQFHAAA